MFNISIRKVINGELFSKQSNPRKNFSIIKILNYKTFSEKIHQRWTFIKKTSFDELVFLENSLMMNVSVSKIINDDISYYESHQQ